MLHYLAAIRQAPYFLYLRMSNGAQDNATTKRGKNASPAFLILFLSFCLSFSFLNMLWYVRLFSFPKEVIWLHLIVVAAAYGTLTLFGFFLSRFSLRRWAISLFAVCSYAVFLGFALLYLLNYFALSNWGQYITFRIVYIFASDVPALLEAVPYDFTPLFFLFVLFFLLSIWILYKVSSPVFASIATLGDRLIEVPQKLVIMIGVPIILLVGISGVHMWKQMGYIKAYFKFHGEPVYNFLKPITATFGKTKIDFEREARVKAVRQNFPRDIAFKQKNVILFIIDAMRDDRMGVYAYERETTPYLSSLRAEGKLQLVEEMSSGCATSFCGILSVLSASYIPNLACTNYKIQDVFKDLGYRSNFLLSGSHNEWYNLRRYHENYHKMDFYKDGSYSANYSLSDDRFLFDCLEEIPAFDGTPSFFYFHLLSAHSSGTKLPEFAKYQPSGKTSYMSPDSILYGNFYDNGVYQADQYLERLMQQLEEKKYLDDALVVFTADHGESLGRKGRFGHGADLYQGAIRIPLAFYDTQQPAEPDLQFGSQVDIAPTILAKLGLPIPETWDGVPLEPTDSIRYTYHRHGKYFAVIRKDGPEVMKLHYISDHNTFELYNLQHDPEESRNLVRSPKHLSDFEDLKEKFETVFEDR